MKKSDEILDDEWGDDVLDQLIEVEVALSSKPKSFSSSVSLSNHPFQHQQPDSSVYSPPRELSQISHSDHNDLQIHHFKQEQREPRHASKQMANLEKECPKLKKERGKKEDQPILVYPENEEDNAPTKRSKITDKDGGIRAPDHHKASSKFQNGVSSNNPTVETTAKSKGIETGIVSHQEAQDPPIDELSAYLDLSEKLLAVWGPQSGKRLGSDVISKLFASCQKDIHNLFSYMSMSPPSEITRKLFRDVSSSRVSLHYVNGCFHTPEAAKVSLFYHALTKIADGTDVLETLIPTLLDLCSMENAVIVHSSLCILHALLKLLLESEKNFGRRDNVFIDGVCTGKDHLDSDYVKDGNPFSKEMLSRKECWNYQSALQQLHVNWSAIFDIMHQISTRITEENVRGEVVSIMILLFLRCNAYFEREQFSQNTVFKAISELLKKDAGLRVKKKTLRLLYLVLNCPKLLATFCCGCKEADSSSAMDDNASTSDIQNFEIILQGLADCVFEKEKRLSSCLDVKKNNWGELQKDLKINRKAILVLAFLASSGQPGFEIFISHRLSNKGVNYLMLILQLLVSEMDREYEAYNELPEIFRERTFLMREILILLNRLVSSPSYSATILHGLTNSDMASLTVDVAIRLSQKGNEGEHQEDSIAKHIRQTEIVNLAGLFKKRTLIHIN